MKIYFMGICGTAMGNAALLMRATGHEVCGADSGVYPPMSTVLAESGIQVFEGYDVQRLEKLAPDLVVCGNAMTRGHDELEWLLDTRKIPYTSLPALLGEHLLASRENIVIAGTHGKTTTTAITAHLLRENGADPGWLVGGVPLDLPTGAHAGGQGAPFVIEGDEYDSAFFDKRSKFIHYCPRILVLNNLEFDHGDIFRDLEDIKRTFRHVSRIVPRSGCILYNGDDENLRELMPVDWTRCISVGTGEDCDVRIRAFKEDERGARFQLLWRGTPWEEVRWNMHGLYNARNAAMASVAAGLALNPQDPFCAVELAALATFQGVKRRQEIRLEREKLVVIEDFAHHPTAIMQALESLRARYAGREVIACFEPRSNTAVTNRFQDAFIRALAHADSVHLAPIHRGERIPVAERLDVAAIASSLKAMGKYSFAHKTHEELLRALRISTQDGGDEAERARVVVFFSNGAFGGVIGKFSGQAG